MTKSSEGLWIRALAAVPTALAIGILLIIAAESAQAQTLKVLHTFSGGTDAFYPNSGLITDKQGDFYGTSRFGGAYDQGAVFKVTRTGKETVLYTFTGGLDGGGPSGIMRDPAGNFYGVTDTGGDGSCNPPYGCGTVFKLDSSGNETVLYSFAGGTDGASPAGNLIQDPAGNFYGVTFKGGDLTCSCGTVFKLDPAGNKTVLYSFTGADGAFPEAGLIRDQAGNLYGTTFQGGGMPSCGCGTVFRVDAAGKETVLHRFAGGKDGYSPEAALLRDSLGNLLGQR